MKFLSLILIFVLVGCSDKPISRGRLTTKGTSRFDKQRRNTPVADWHVECADKKNCPGFVGQLLVRNTAGVETVCTAFLKDSETVITNSHCIPEPERCHEGVSIHFPETSTLKEEHLFCDKIVDQSEEVTNPLKADYAIFKITTKSLRSTVALDQSTGVKNNESLKIIKIDPVANSRTKGILKVEDVRVIYKTFESPASNSAFSSVHAIAGGQVISGNSGSPVVTSDLTNVKLIAQSIIDRKLSDFPSLIEYLVKTGPALAYATNATCVSDSRSDKCEEISAESLSQLKINAEKLLSATSEDEAQMVKLATNSNVGSKVLRPKFKIKTIPALASSGWHKILEFKSYPGCFENPKTWSNDLKSGKSFKDTATISWNLQTFSKQLSINDNGMIVSRIVPDSSSNQSIELKFSPSEVASKSSSTLVSPTLERLDLLKNPVEVCKSI